MIYTWKTFVLSEALSGTLVGFQQTDAYNLSMTGRLVNGNGATPYKVTFGGFVFWVDGTGKVVDSVPSSSYINQTLKMVTTVLDTNFAIGKSGTRSSGTGSDAQHNATVDLATVEPRDSFAISILNAMLVHAEHPETFDDATCLYYSRAAYRWAQAVMIAAADAREGTSTVPSAQTNVNSNDLQSNTEKLLYNVNDTLKAIKTQFATQYTNSHSNGSLKVNVTNNPTPTPTPTGANPVITFNVRITNNTGSPVTLDGFMRFFVGNPDHNGVYCGWNGVYNSSERATFSPTAVTLAAGDSQIFSVTPVLGDTDGLGEKSPLSPDLLYAAERSRNVCVYVGGVSETVLCANMPTSIIFEEGGTYDVILGG